MTQSHATLAELTIAEGIALRLPEEADAAELYAAIDANRSQLARWMPWGAGQTLADTRAFIKRAREQAATGEALQLAIVERERIVGMVGFTGIFPERRSATIGYWLAKRSQGRGTMTRAVRKLVEHAFDALALERVEIRAGVENARSRAIPERLGFSNEGVLPAAEFVDGRYIDQAVYAITVSRWRKQE